jgi:hypothetical protein
MNIDKVPSKRKYYIENLEGFSELNRRTQNLAIKCLFSNSRHRVFKEAKSFNRSWLSHPTVGADHRRFDRMNDKLGLFWTDGKYKPGVFSRAYWLTDKGRDAIIGYVSVCHPRDLMEICEKNHIDVDVYAVYDYMNQTANPNEITMCCELIGNVAEGTNIIKAEHMKVPCGRRVYIGYNMQNMPKWLRNVALKGWWDYDFKNCHYVITSTLGDFPAINEYVNYSDEIREQLAARIGSQVKPVKLSLLALLYGAKRKPTPNSAVYDYLGKAKAKKFMEDSFVQRLLVDIDNLIPIIMKNLSEHPTIKQDDEHSAAAQYLMMMESQMLDVAVKGVKNPIYMFDGFMSKERQDKDYIQSRIRRATGIPIVVTEERIGN